MYAHHNYGRVVVTNAIFKVPKLFKRASPLIFSFSSFISGLFCCSMKSLLHSTRLSVVDIEASVSMNEIPLFQIPCHRSPEDLRNSIILNIFLVIFELQD